MSIPFTCPHCGVTTQVADQYAGQTGPCGSCGKTITVPTASSVPVAGSYAAPAPPKSGMSTAAIVLIVLIVVFGPVVAFLSMLGLTALGCCSGCLLLPAVSSAQETAMRVQCGNNLKQIALALHNYHDAHGSFPPAFVADADGMPLYSWRVLILPFLGQEALYQRFDLSQAWDSPDNMLISETVIPTFHCPSDPDDESSKTFYKAIVGDGMAFEGTSGVKRDSFTDGEENTILVVESSTTPVPWASPSDLDAIQMDYDISAAAEIGDFSSFHSLGTNCVFADGSVHFLSWTLPAETVEGLATRNGGESVSLPEESP